MLRNLGRPGRLLFLFGLLSLAAVATGAMVCASNGVAAGSWMRNLAAWVVGAVAATAIARAYHDRMASAFLWAMPIGLAACFLNPDQSGVHRWVDAGPLHVNMAMLLLPAATVSLASRTREGMGMWIVVLATLGLLVAQPDASQAATAGAVAAVVALATVRNPGQRLVLVVAICALAGFAWLRPDPLKPVAEVEEIIGLAWTLSPIMAGTAVVLLAAIAATPTAVTLTSPAATRLAGFGLSVVFGGWAITPLLGAFPVPFVGIGMSAILGAWLGVGMLAGLLTRGDGLRGE